MATSEFVDAKWAREIVERFNEVIDEWNSLYPKAINPMALVWGYANADEGRQETCYRDTDSHRQGALIQYSGHDLEMVCSKHGDSSHPNRCTVRMSFDGEWFLPLVADELYNVLRACDAVVSLDCVPHDGQIGIAGVSASFWIETMSVRTLNDILFELCSSGSLVLKQLRDQEGDDWWAIDGGDL